VTKRIALCLLLATGCASEASDAGRDAPSTAPAETPGAESLTPSVPEAPESISPVVDPPLLAWSFEPASADCNGWPVLGADAIRASPAHSGTYSCKVCSNGSADGLGLMRELGAVPAGRYVLSAWVRKRIQNAAPGEALARIEADTPVGVTSSIVTPSVSVREEWDRVETTIDLDGGASAVRVTIGAATAETDHCLFIDDVTLVRQ